MHNRSLTLTGAMLMAASMLSAGPAFLDRASLKAAVNGTITVVDNLDSLPPQTFPGANVALLNGEFVTSRAQLLLWANMARALGEFNYPAEPSRTFTFRNFTGGTQFFGVEAQMSDGDTFRITAVGNSGTTVVQQKGKTLNGYVGFSDPTGLISVTIQDLGTLTTPNRFGIPYFAQITTSLGQPGPVVVIPPFVAQSAKADCTGAGLRGSVQAKSTASVVTLQVNFEAPGTSASLYAGSTKVAELFPRQRAPYNTTTEAPLLDRIPNPYKLTFDPYGNVYTVRSDDGTVTYLTCTLGGQAAGGDLPRVP